MHKIWTIYSCAYQSFYEKGENVLEELLILVNDDDNEIGYEEKMETHIQEKLHRAFSLFIYNKTNNTLLIHKRAEGKYHSGGLWTNSCCSHPRKGENLQTAVVRRVKQELGLDLFDNQLKIDANKIYECGLYELGSFKYYKKFKNCAEFEIDHVFYLPLNEEEIKLHLNKTEIAEVMWISIDKLKKWLSTSPDKFTAWFPKAFDIVLEKVFC